MDVAVRPLATHDIEQVREIEREAFSSSWPPTSFKRELENRQAACLVAWEPWPEGPAPLDSTASSTPKNSSSLSVRLVDNLRRFVGQPRQLQPALEHIVGYVGMWFMGPEAHITAIAVREELRGQGIGELLLAGSIEVAMKRGSQVVSLEARASNHVAQSLYEKYGFVHAGIRKGYYTDNREDAVIMTTQPINTPEYKAKFNQLRDAYQQRRGQMTICLSPPTTSP